jgi:hypothetical protein
MEIFAISRSQAHFEEITDPRRNGGKNHLIKVIFLILLRERLTTMEAILALGLGKFKTMSCLLTEDHASIPVFKTNMTYPNTFEQFLLDVKPSLLVLEACGPSGWVVDL